MPFIFYVNLGAAILCGGAAFVQFVFLLGSILKGYPFWASCVFALLFLMDVAFCALNLSLVLHGR